MSSHPFQGNYYNLIYMLDKLYTMVIEVHLHRFEIKDDFNQA